MLDRLEAHGRLCPIILISCSDADQKPMLDANGLAEDFEDQNIDLSKEISRLNYLVQDMNEKHASACDSVRLAASRIDALKKLTTFQTTVREVAHMVQSLHPAQIVFTEEVCPRTTAVQTQL